MSAMPSPAQATGLPRVETSVDAPGVRPPDLKTDRFPNGRSSLGRRALLALARFLIIFCIGVAATLAWQSYGDAAREMIASLYPPLNWLAPQPASIAHEAPDLTTAAAQAAPSVDRQQLDAISLDLEALRQSVDGIATSIAITRVQLTGSMDQIAPRIVATQQQMMHSIDQLAAGQEQMASEIAKLQAVEQSVVHTNSEPPPRPGPGPPRNRVPRPPQATPAAH